MLVVGTSKRAWNGGKRTRFIHKADKKRGRFVYFYNENGLFSSKRVSFCRYWYIKIFVKKVKIKRCKTCRKKVIGDCDQCL